MTSLSHSLSPSLARNGSSSSPPFLFSFYFPHLSPLTALITHILSLSHLPFPLTCTSLSHHCLATVAGTITIAAVATFPLSNLRFRVFFLKPFIFLSLSHFLCIILLFFLFSLGIYFSFIFTCFIFYEKKSFQIST